MLLSEQSTTKTSLFRHNGTESINSNWWALSFFRYLHLIYLKYLISLTLKSWFKTFSRANTWAYACFSRREHTIRGISAVLCSLAGFMEVFCVLIVTNTWIIYFITFWAGCERKQECVCLGQKVLQKGMFVHFICFKNLLSTDICYSIFFK